MKEFWRKVSKQLESIPLRRLRAPSNDLPAALSAHDRSRFAYPAACADDDDALVFDALYEVLPSPTSQELLQSATVTRKKVAGMEVASLFGLLFWLANNSSSSLCRSAARPFFSAASNAFMVGP